MNADVMREADLLNVVRQTGVESLTLRDVQLSDHACIALGTIPTLKDLRIEGARIGDGAVEQLVRGGLEQVLVIFAATDADPIPLAERLARQFPSRQFSSGNNYLQFARTKTRTP